MFLFTKGFVPLQENFHHDLGPNPACAGRPLTEGTSFCRFHLLNAGWGLAVSSKDWSQLGGPTAFPKPQYDPHSGNRGPASPRDLRRKDRWPEHRAYGALGSKQWRRSPSMGAWAQTSGAPQRCPPPRALTPHWPRGGWAGL